MVLIFKFYSAPMRLCDVKNPFKPEKTFKQARVSFFTAKKDVISQLRHSYAMGPFLRDVAPIIFKFLIRFFLQTLAHMHFCFKQSPIPFVKTLLLDTEEKGVL